MNAFEAAARMFEPPVDVFTVLGYEPNCLPRIEAARQHGFEFPVDAVRGGCGERLPDPCGQCPQERFHAATEFDVLYGGAAGGGKTRALLMDAIRDCVRYPGLRVGAFRRTFGELEESLRAELAEIGYAQAVGARYDSGKHDLKFPNGARIMFRYVETMADATRRQGGQYQKLIFDERNLTPPAAIDFLYGRLRSGNSRIPVLGVRSGTNPGGAGHGASKARFVDATDHGARTYLDARGRSVAFIPSRASDNPHLNPEYVEDLKGLPAQMRAAFLDGSWDSFVGQVFTEWNHDRHVVARFPVPDEWARHSGTDYGYAAPWCTIWAARDGDGRLWVYREVYASGVGERDQARRILELEAGERVQRVGDPSMWAKTGTALPVASQYHLEGVAVDKADNDRLSGWQRIHTYLADGPACPIHREQGETACPMLHVLEGAAPNLVRTLPSAPYDQKKVEDLDTTYEDHALDALRYLVMSIGTGAKVVFAPDEPDQVALDGSPLMRDAGGGIAFGANWTGAGVSHLIVRP